MLVQSHLHSAPKLAAGVASLPSTGSAIARRLLVATVACVVVWQLQADDSPPAREFKNILVRLSGRQMKRTRPHTAPALPDRESWTVGQVANLPHSPRAATQASTHAAQQGQRPSYAGSRLHPAWLDGEEDWRLVASPALAFNPIHHPGGLDGVHFTSAPEGREIVAHGASRGWARV
jgi:hypothetical protein